MFRSIISMMNINDRRNCMALSDGIRRGLLTVVPVLFVLAFASALSLNGCAPKMPPEPEWEKDARAFLDQAEHLYSGKQFDQAAKAADAFFTQYPQSRHADRALYLLGEIRLSHRNFRQALSYYKEIVEKYPASPYIPDAKYKLGRCYFELKEYDLAVANLEDRSRIEDPARRRNISEMLSYAYVVKQNYALALREFVFLVANSGNEMQRTGYRDRVREIIENNLSGDELASLAAGAAYPADLAQLRLAALLIEQRNYRDAIRIGNDFLQRFPGHPERTRAEMLLNEATTGMTAPRYSLGVLVPQSGQLAFFGDRVLKGIQLAVHAHNSRQPDSRVDLIVKDTEGSPEKALAAVNELAAAGAVAAIGPITNREEEAIAPVLENLQVPVLRPAASRSGFSVKTDWLFRNALTIDSQAYAAAQYAAEAGLERFVIFYPDEPYGKDLASLFAGELERKTEILARISYPPNTKDFGPYIRKIIEIDLRSRKIQAPEDEAERKKFLDEYVPGFDALYLPGYAEQVGLLIPQLAFYNISGLAMIGSDNWHSQALIERAGRHAEGAVFVDGFFPESGDPEVKAFVDSYRSAYQEEPGILAAQAYDSAMMIFSLLKQRIDKPLAIRESLLLLQEYNGITGNTGFAGFGEARKKLFLIKVQDGKFTLSASEK